MESFLLTTQACTIKSEGLFSAIEKGNLEGVKSAIKKGADINVKDTQGKTALDIVRETARIDKERAKFGPVYKIRASVANKIEDYLQNKINR